MNDKEVKAIVTVIGKDKKGIIARVSGTLAQAGANVEDISQTVMQGYFMMMMLVNISGADKIRDLGETLDRLGEEIGVKIRIQHEDIFNAMHRI